MLTISLAALKNAFALSSQNAFSGGYRFSGKTGASSSASSGHCGCLHRSGIKEIYFLCSMMRQDKFKVCIGIG